MLRMNMTNAERDLVKVHKKALETFPAYKCNCCRQVVFKGQDKPLIDVFRVPKGARLCAKGSAATFIICEACQKLPDKEIEKGVLAGFLIDKLAVMA